MKLLATTASLDQFVRYVTLDLKRPDDKLVTFRGEPNSIWRPKPRIYRYTNKLRQAERDITRELMSVQPQEFASDYTMFDRLVRMQHFGLPTRLLDVVETHSSLCTLRLRRTKLTAVKSTGMCYASMCRAAVESSSTATASVV